MLVNKIPLPWDINFGLIPCPLFARMGEEGQNFDRCIKATYSYDMHAYNIYLTVLFVAIYL